jgi:hypothetical protein
MRANAVEHNDGPGHMRHTKGTALGSKLADLALAGQL